MEVWHMNGAGNDFAVVDARGKTLDFSRLALKLCKLTGADGFLALDDSEKGDIRLHFYNADGSRGETCGNGCSCICRFAYEKGVVGDAVTVETDAGLVYAARLSENRYRLKLNNPGVVDLNRKPGVAYLELGVPGVPHAVMEVPGLEWNQAEKLRETARSLRYDPAFPKGVNVNFYGWLDEITVRILTYERGVEDYTLACGTGSASTAVTLWLQEKIPEDTLTVENPGGNLTVTLSGKDGVVDSILLEGPTEVVRKYEM